MAEKQEIKKNLSGQDSLNTEFKSLGKENLTNKTAQPSFGGVSSFFAGKKITKKPLNIKIK